MDKRRTGARLKKLRESCGLTQIAASRVAGVHVVTYARWEAGKGGCPRVEALTLLSRLYGTTIGYLLGGRHAK